MTAAPLDPAACEGLKAEKNKAAATGLTGDIERGPDWAKANLSPDRLKEIEHFLEIDEQIAYRCPRPRPPAPPANSAATTGTPAEQAVPGKKKSSAKPAQAASGEEAEAGVPGVVPVKPQKDKRKAVQIIIKKPVGAGANAAKVKAGEAPANSGASNKTSAAGKTGTAKKPESGPAVRPPEAAAVSPAQQEPGASDGAAPAPDAN